MFSQEIALTRLHLPAGCKVTGWLGPRIKIECPTLEERNFIFNAPDSFCLAALAMGYERVVFSVAGTRIRHQFKITAMLAFSQEFEKYYGPGQ
jgi:hypothetical protein